MCWRLLGRWPAGVNVVFCGGMACWGTRLFVCGIIIIGYWYLVVGGVWLTQMVFGVRWCIVGCLGWHMVVVPGPAAGDCHGVWWLRVVWVCCVRTG